MDGLSVEEGAPHLASQHADYLYAQLKAYKDGARKHARMRRSIKILNDDALRSVAAYYFSLDLPHTPGPQQGAGAESQPASVDDVSPEEAGKAASTGCASCHGRDGNSVLPGMPSLAGQNLEYLVNAMNAYREASRKDPMMRPAVALLNDDTIENLALFYALQDPKASPLSADGDAAAGEPLATACAECHGADGNSEKPDTPSLAGQDPKYLVTATHSYKNGTRDHSAMQSLVASLNDNDIKNVAAYYASLTPKGGAARKPLTTSQWAERCDRCHGLNGNSTDPQIPSISSQSEEYLINAMTAYREQDRGNKIMRAMLQPIKDVEIDNLARYYADKRRRAVVFIRTPCK
jgi:cytochrome c553